MGFLLLNPIENIVASSRAVREKLSKNRSQLCKDHQAQMERLRSIVPKRCMAFMQRSLFFLLGVHGQRDGSIGFESRVR